ncbi:MAG: ATP-dependent Clp protease ATP-binding subunit [Bacteroidales bacterium]|nr:ATP-dependent Clp protease ATP-binding subunit [Bacteroidales bacterium]MDY3912316.1 ATP-dependent Clp protease ATP-binding subunit [Sodaliphilus sp.]
MIKRAFNSVVSRILIHSQHEALRLNCHKLQPEHVLLGILKTKDSNAYQVFEDLHAPIPDIELRLETEINGFSSEKCQGFNGDDTECFAVSQSVSDLLRDTLLEAERRQTEVAGSGHMLLAMLRSGNDTFNSKLMKEMNIDYDKVNKILSSEDFVAPEAGADFAADDDTIDDDGAYGQGSAAGQGGQTAQRRSTAATGKGTPSIDKYGKDITRAAADGKLDPVIGREREIERLAQILSRRKKNNPVLIGEPGVGKSAIIEGLALRIVTHKVARVLFDKRIVALDMASVVAGTKYRGQFEERIKSIIDEAAANPNLILFIDEIHTIVGAGNASGTMDAANLLKPALARGEIQCIGATTIDEYRKNIEKDGALERRFQKVMVEPTTPEQTLEILKNIKGVYEKHHGVAYTDAALEACVKLTDRYVSDRFFPDKAIDALDEAGARSRISKVVVPKEIGDLEKQVAEAQANKLKAVQAQNFESAAGYRDQQEKLQASLEQAKADWEQKLDSHRETVDEADVAEVVAMMTGVPVQRIAQSEGLRLLGMADDLKSKVVGQDEAIDKIVRAIRRNRVGLKDPNRPIGSFMFLGSTGVGKTLLAKRLAEFLFNSADSLIRIDMSEYMEKFTVSRLVGAPPGYVGYEEGGQLTEKVRRHPYSVVLLDEVEKAHPDVFNMLLQVLDEGNLTDSLGRKVDFKNTIIIMTSNIGTRELKDFGAGVGFNTSVITKERTDSVIRKALNRNFSPEFLNRIDDIITFASLDKQAIGKIIDIELAAFYKRIDALGYRLSITDAAKQFIADKGYDNQYGARPLKRAIQTYVEDPLSELMLKHEGMAEGTEMVIDVDGDNVKARLATEPVREEQK